MKNLNYIMLTKNLAIIDEKEKLRIVNKRIDEIILNTENPKESLQALICLFEAKNNLAAPFTTMTMSYALLIGGASLLAQVDGVHVYAGFVLMIFAIVVAIMGAKNKEERDGKGFCIAGNEIPL